MVYWVIGKDRAEVEEHANRQSTSIRQVRSGGFAVVLTEEKVKASFHKEMWGQPPNDRAMFIVKLAAFLESQGFIVFMAIPFRDSWRGKAENFIQDLEFVHLPV